MTLHHGDCLDVMAAMEPESVDAVVTDPPYGLEFMGKEWDKVGRRIGHPLDPNKVIEKDSSAAPRAKDNPWQKEASGYGAPSKNWRCRKCGRLKFGQDQYRCRCEKPDWDARTREYGLVMQQWHERWAEAAYRIAKPSAYLLAFGGTRTVHRMTVAIEDAGWIIRDMLVWAYASGFPKSKASLKPAWEPIVMARKPGPLRELAIDACRIEGGPKGEGGRLRGATGSVSAFNAGNHAPVDDTLGRWPANVILTDPIFDGGWDGVVGGGEASYNPSGAFGVTKNATGRIYGGGQGIVQPGLDVFGYGDSGTYSRFFILPKADRADREPVLGGLPVRHAPHGNYEGRDLDNPKNHLGGMQGSMRQNSHPTVKPVDLMRHLVRLVTPTGGIVLDPFAGSGSTLLAAEMEGFEWIGIEKEAEYVAIAEARLNGTQRGLGLPA